jgi:hypothetical protein
MAQWSVSPFNPANNWNGTEVRDWKLLNTLGNGNVLGFQERVTRKIVSELRGFDNLIFEIQNEPWADRTVVGDAVNPYVALKWPNTADLADEESLAWQKRVAEWIRSEEAGLKSRHSIAWNVCNFKAPLREVLEGADTVNFHYAYPEAALWNLELGVPLGYDETGFLKADDAAYRKQAWRFMLAGGGLFNHLDYSFSVGKEDGTDHQPKSPGGGGPALRRQFRFLREFLESLPFLRMEPGGGFLARTPGLAAQSLSAPGEAYAAYLEGRSSGWIEVRLPEGRYDVEWIDPAAAQSARGEALQHRGGLARLRTPSGREELALRIRKQAARK